MKTTFIAIAALAAFILAPSTVSAGDAPKISYSAKKQGKVAFKTKTKTQDQAAAAQERYDGVNPSDIEPAAGGYEPSQSTKENSVADRIKLPRKN